MHAHLSGLKEYCSGDSVEVAWCQVISLYVRGRGETYGRGDDDKLLRELEITDQATTFLEVTRWQDLALRQQGTTADGYRYTQQGLRQVCALLSPGLFRFLVEFSGIQRHLEEPVSEFSLSGAVAVFNTVLQRRCAGRLEGRVKIVRDGRLKTIDGVIGSRFIVLDNLRFCNRTREAMAAAGRGLVLFEAGLAGRRLTLRFVERKSLAADPGGQRWHAGLWLGNSEVGGETPVCGSVLLCDPALRHFALGPTVGGQRVIHTGKGFEQKLAVLYQTTAASAGLSAKRLSACFDRLASRRLSPLAVGGGLRQYDGTIERIFGRSLPVEVARQVVIAAMHGGACDAEKPYLPAFPDGAAVASEFVLFRTLAAAAQSRHPALRERIERAAFGLLRV